MFLLCFVVLFHGEPPWPQSPRASFFLYIPGLREDMLRCSKTSWFSFKKKKKTILLQNTGAYLQTAGAITKNMVSAHPHVYEICLNNKKTDPCFVEEVSSPTFCAKTFAVTIRMFLGWPNLGSTCCNCRMFFSLQNR